MPRNYNPIYSKIVENEFDLVGHIAYSLYKKQKIEYIQSHKLKNERDIHDVELIPFNEFSSSPVSIKGYRIQAETILQGFLENLFADQLEEYKQELKDDYTNLISEALEPIKPSKKSAQFWFGVWQGVVATFVFTLIVGLIIFFLQMKDSGPKDAVEKAFNVKIITNPAQSDTCNKSKK